MIKVPTLLYDPHFLKRHQIVDWGLTHDPFPKSSAHYLDWLKEGHAGPLEYMADERRHPRLNLKTFFPEFQSAIVLLISYGREKREMESFYQGPNSNGLKMAGYTFYQNGQDYHKALMAPLEQLKNQLVKSNPKLSLKLSLDMHPVLERDLAYKAGLGWFGKNSMLINRRFGSYTLLASLFLSEKIKLSKEGPIRPLETDHCGHCRRCIEVCPTEAITEERTLKANRCLTTFTVETFRPSERPEGGEKASNLIFGCDLCQDICPWNAKTLSFGPLDQEEGDGITSNTPSPATSKITEYFLKRPLEQVSKALKSLSNRKFRKDFAETSLARTGRVGLLKNLPSDPKD